MIVFLKINAHVYVYRICPGMHLAENSIFIAVASLLSTFDFSKARDGVGNVVEPIVDFTGFIRYATFF